MYIPEEFKTNRFKAVRIPTKGEYFNTGRFQQVPEIYGGEDPVRVNAELKVEKMAAYEKELEKANQDNE